MEHNNRLTKTVTIVGLVLIWIPLLAPAVLSIEAFFSIGRFLFDYLMPAELFSIAAGGALLLIWASFRVRSRRRVIGWGSAAAVLLLYGGQGIAVVTGLASGEREAAGWPFFLAVGSIIMYAVMLAVIGVGGILLVKDLVKDSRSAKA